MSSHKRSPGAAADLLAKGALPPSDLGRGIASFVSVGLVASLVYLVATWVLVKSLGIGAIEASILGYLAGIVVSYGGQSRLTFRAAGSRQAIARFVVVSLLGIACSVGLMFLLHELWGFEVIYPIAATCLLVPALSFLAMNFYVFIGGRK